MIKIHPKQTMLEVIPEKNLRMRRRTLKIVKMIRRMKKNQRKTEIKKMKIKKKRKKMEIKKKIQVLLS